MLNRERVNRERYRTLDIARADLFNYIERFHIRRMRRRVEKSELGIFMRFTTVRANEGQANPR